jgi:hypothetical protein
MACGFALRVAGPQGVYYPDPIRRYVIGFTRAPSFHFLCVFVRTIKNGSGVVGDGSGVVGSGWERLGVHHILRVPA